MTFELVPAFPSTVAMHKGIWRRPSRLPFTSVGSEVKERKMSHQYVETGTSIPFVILLSHNDDKIQYKHTIQEQNGNEL